jgi:hypothetical protein
MQQQIIELFVKILLYITLAENILRQVLAREQIKHFKDPTAGVWMLRISELPI